MSEIFTGLFTHSTCLVQMKTLLRCALEYGVMNTYTRTIARHPSRTAHFLCQFRADYKHTDQWHGPRLTTPSFRWINICNVYSPAEIRSPFPDVQIPNISFAEYMFSKCDEYKELVAVEDYVTRKKYTFKELKNYSIKVASALHNKGYRKGDVIATFTNNLPEFSILIMASAALGVIVTSVNPSYTAVELCLQLRSSEAKSIFTVVQLVPVVKKACKNMQENIKEVYTFDGVGEKTVSFHTLMEDCGRSFPQNIIKINALKDILFLPYSSGTTGLPKGVMLTHYNVVANLHQIRTLPKIECGDSCLGLLPFFHIYGFTTVLFGCLQMGGRLVTVPHCEPQICLKAVQQEKITILHSVPTIVKYMAKHPTMEQFDISSLKCVVSNAAPLSEGVTLEFKKKHGIPVIQAYGLTETSPMVNVDVIPESPGTIGVVLPNTVCKIVNAETGKPVQIGEMGEYCMKGPQRMHGYLNNPQATEEIIDQDGWLHTGDVGHLRNDGRVVIEDRLKELIKYKGFQVLPAELESLLLTHPAVKDAAVIGMPDEVAGELPQAYIVLKKNTSALADDIVRFIAERVAPSKRLRGGVEFVNEIPKSACGKILRRILRAKVSSSSHRHSLNYIPTNNKEK